MTSRRDQILQTAAELFARDGFHGVSITELGAACGMSGPALYKHFRGKQAILSTMLVQISEELLQEGRRRVAEAEDTAQALDTLVAWHVDFALRQPSLIVVQERDWAALPLEAREKVRTLQREYVDLWAGVVLQLHAGLTREVARAAVHATFGLINSTPHSALIPRDDMAALLAAMARSALTGTLVPTG